MGDSDGGSCGEYSEGHMTDDISKLVEELGVDFSLPSVGLSQITLSRDHNQRVAEVKEGLSKRKGLDVLIVDIDRRRYFGRVSDTLAETYILETGNGGYSKGFNFISNLKYMNVGALFYVDVK